MRTYTTILSFILILHSAFGIKPGTQLGNRGFIENKGQLRDDSGKVRTDVLFYLESSTTNVYITNKGICYYLFEREQEHECEEDQKWYSFKKINYKEEATLKWEAIYMSLKNASIQKKQILAQNPVDGLLNFYKGNIPQQWALGVRQYQKITIQSVYPGIDWILYTTPKGIKYDFEVHPNANPNNIELLFTSLRAPKLNEHGSLSIKTGVGSIIEEPPYSYLSNKLTVPSAYKIKSSNRVHHKHLTTVKFELGEYNKSEKLIIDPNLVWSSMYGGSLADGGWDIKLNSTNELFVTGEVQSASFPVIDPGGSTLFNGTMGGLTWSWDSFLMKYNTNGALIWSTYIGGDNNDVAKTLAINSGGDLYLAGSTSSTNVPIITPPGSYAGSNTGGYIMRFNSSGTLLWATCLDSAGITDIAVDAFDNLFVTGSTSSSYFPVLNAYQPTLKTGSSTSNVDMFLTKFNTANQMQWSTYFGGKERDYANSIATNGNGNVVIAGMTNSPDIPTLGAFDNVLNNATPSQTFFTDGFFAEFTPTGSLQWATFIGGASFGIGATQDDVINDIAIDNNNNLFALGHSSAANFPITTPTGAYSQATLSGGAADADFILMKFNSTRSLTWSTYYGGNGIEGDNSQFIHNPDAITVAPSGDVYIAGTTRSTNFPTKTLPGCSYNQTTHGGGTKDMCILQFDNNGARKWATYLGNSSYEWACGITIDPTNCIYVVGEISDAGSGITFPMKDMGGGAYYEKTFKGGEDGTILKLCPYSAVFTATASVLNATCGSTCNGVATVAPLGGGGPYNYLWDNGATTSTISGLCAGATYTATVTDNCGSSTTATVTINPSTTYTLSTSGSSTPCGQSTGTANVNVSGTGNFTYLWNNNGATTNSISGLSAGVYTVIVTDASGCTTIDSAIVTQSSGALTIPLATNITTCESSLSLNAGNAGSTYLWSTTETSQIISITTSGTYSVLVTDISGCTGTASTQVLIGSPPVVNLNNTNTCASQLTLDAGNAGATYLWNNNATTQTINVTSSGTYSVVVTNAQNCSASKSIQVQLGSNPVILLNDTISCLSSVNLNAGNIGSTYLWSTTATTQTIQVNSNGTYSLTVTDAQGCTASKSIQVTIAAAPLLNVPPVSTCENSATLNAGVSGLNYNWNNGAGTNQTFTVNSSGTYTVTVTNSSNCSASATAQVDLKPKPTIFLGNDTTICSSTPTLNFLLNAQNPGASYLWNNGATTQNFTVNSAGIWGVVVTAANGCSASDSIQINTTSSPIINITSANTCASQLILDAENTGASYLWSTGATTQTINVTNSNVYSVIVTNAQNCSSSKSVVIQLNTKPVVLLNDTSTCSNQLTLNAGNPGATYSWSNGGTNQTLITNISATYTVTITDGAGCTATGSSNVTFNLPPIVSLGNNQSTCNTSVNLDAGNPGSVYLWNNGSSSQTITATTSGTYSIIVTDINGCTASDQVQIQINPNPLIPIPASLSTCNASILLDASNPGATYSWSNGSTTQTVLVTASGLYKVVVTNTQGCKDSINTNITINQPPIINIPATIQSCNTSVLLDALNPGSTYTWSNGATTQQILVTQNGIYNVMVTDGGGCTTTASTNVQLFTAPTVNPQNVNVCDTITILDAGNGFTTYSWSNGVSTQFATVTTTGIYTVTVTNNNNCSATATASVILNKPPTLSVPTSLSSCATPVTVTAIGSNINTYSWNNGSTTQQITVNTSGNYNVIVTSAQGCTKTASCAVQINPIPTISLNDTAACSKPLLLNAQNSGSTFSWGIPGGNVSTLQQISANTAGIYTLVVTNAQNCSATKSFNVTFNSPPIVSISNDTTIELESTTQLMAIGGTQFNWIPTTGLTCYSCPNPYASPLSTTTYTVMITDANHCSASKDVTVYVTEIKCGELFIPTAFSPNDDAINDTWKIRGAKCITKLELQVFNRWGELVFETFDANIGWNGVWRGQQLNSGVFVYQLKANFRNGKTIEQKGNITLVR